MIIEFRNLLATNKLSDAEMVALVAAAYPPAQRVSLCRVLGINGENQHAVAAAQKLAPDLGGQERFAKMVRNGLQRMLDVLGSKDPSQNPLLEQDAPPADVRIEITQWKPELTALTLGELLAMTAAAQRRLGIELVVHDGKQLQLDTRPQAAETQGVMFAITGAGNSRNVRDLVTQIMSEAATHALPLQMYAVQSAAVNGSRSGFSVTGVIRRNAGAKQAVDYLANQIKERLNTGKLDVITLNCTHLKFAASR
jgi:hypothetical protein